MPRKAKKKKKFSAKYECRNIKLKQIKINEVVVLVAAASAAFFLLKCAVIFFLHQSHLRESSDVAKNVELTNQNS